VNGPPGNSHPTSGSTYGGRARARLAPVALPPALFPPHIGLARQHRQQRIGPELLMIVEILVAQRQTIDSLPHQSRNTMLDPARIAAVLEAAGELPRDARLLLGPMQQQPARLRGNRSSVKVRHHLAATLSSESEAGFSTLCHSEKPFLSGSNVLS